MAIKKGTEKATEETAKVENQTEGTEQETPQAGVEGNETQRKAKAPRRPWGATQEQADERDQALASVLKQPRPNGSVMTAGSVAQALSQMPEFAGDEISSTRVAARVKQIQSAIEAKGKTPPDWLKLDSARRTVNLDLFVE